MLPLLEYGCLLRRDQLIYYNTNVLIYIQLQKGLCAILQGLVMNDFSIAQGGLYIVDMHTNINYCGTMYMFHSFSATSIEVRNEILSILICHTLISLCHTLISLCDIFYTGNYVNERPWSQRVHITQNFWYNQSVQL